VTGYPDEIVRSVFPGRAVTTVETPPEGNHKRTRVVTLDDGRWSSSGPTTRRRWPSRPG